VTLAQVHRLVQLGVSDEVLQVLLGWIDWSVPDQAKLARELVYSATHDSTRDRVLGLHACAELVLVAPIREHLLNPCAEPEVLDAAVRAAERLAEKVGGERLVDEVAAASRREGVARWVRGYALQLLHEWAEAERAMRVPPRCFDRALGELVQCEHHDGDGGFCRAPHRYGLAQDTPCEKLADYMLKTPG